MNDRQVQALAERCREIREWHKTGLLCDGEIRKLAVTMPASDEHVRLRLAEDRTAAEAMEFVMRSRTPSAPDVAMREAFSKFVAATRQYLAEARRRLDADIPKDAPVHPVSAYLLGVAIEIGDAEHALSASEAKAGEPDETSLKLPTSANETRGGAGDDCSVGKRGVWPPEGADRQKHRLNDISQKQVVTAGETAPTPAVDREAVARLARLRFFRDLIEADRIKFYKAFDVLPQDYDEPLTLGIEGKLFDTILSLLAPTAPAQEGE